MIRRSKFRLNFKKECLIERTDEGKNLLRLVVESRGIRKFLKDGFLFLRVFFRGYLIVS